MHAPDMIIPHWNDPGLKTFLYGELSPHLAQWCWIDEDMVDGWYDNAFSSLSYDLNTEYFV